MFNPFRTSRLLLLGLICLTGLIAPSYIYGQCPTRISTFPYTEGFEANDGNWVTGGTASDWAWGTPVKSIINAAGSGTKCWITGGLFDNFYNNGEASWLRSPCFDFTNVTHPYIAFKVFWETERTWDGANFQYSLDNGVTWITAGSSGDPNNCLNENWFNYPTIRGLNPLTSNTAGWTGSSRPTQGSCQGGFGSNGWVTAKHTFPNLAGQSSVVFRFTFGAGTTCNNFNGFAIDDIFIGEAPVNQASFTYTCNGNQQVSFTNTSTPCPTTIQWNFGDPSTGINNTSAAANPSHLFSAGGTYTVTLTVGGPDNASSTTTQTITVLESQENLLSPVSCNGGSDAVMTVDVIGTTDPVTYNWSTTPAQNSQTATNLSAGNYTVTVSSNNACPSSSTFTLFEPTAITHTATTTAPACNTANGSIDLTVTGGTPGYTYSWSPNVSTGSRADNLRSGAYTITITDSRNCTHTATVILNDQNAPVITGQSSTNVSCFNGTNGSITTTISGGTPGYTYSWSPSGGVQANATNLSAGTYTLTARDQSGCIAQYTQTITQPAAALSVTVSVVDATCGNSNGSIQTNATGGTTPYQYTWTPTTITGASATTLTPGNYSVTITDANNCTTSTPVLTVQNRGSIAPLNLGRDTTLCFGETLVLAPQGNYQSYLWQDGSTGSTFLISEPGTYSLRVESTDGCQTSDAIVVQVNPACNAIYFPTAFTPNNDGRNDLFGPIGNLAGLSNYQFSIYNRWGQRIFFTNDPYKKWDGRVQGTTSSSTVYTWFARFSLNGASVETRKGTILLIR